MGISISRDSDAAAGDGGYRANRHGDRALLMTRNFTVFEAWASRSKFGVCVQMKWPRSKASNQKISILEEMDEAYGLVI
jgi:hypothetical protein